MNSRKNSYGTAASPLFPRFPLNPRSTIFVSYSLPSFPSPRPLPSLTVFSASPTLCVSSSRGNAYKKKFVAQLAQKVLLHFFANNSLGKRRERDKEKNRLLVPGNLDRPRDFFPCAEEERNELSPKRINEGALSLSRRVEVNGRQTTSPEQASRAAALCLRGRKRGGILRADKISCPLLASMLAE